MDDILLRLLLPFRGLFFASTGLVPDVGGGAGDGGGEGGGGGEEIPAEGGGEEVVEEPEDIPADEGEEQPIEEEPTEEEGGDATKTTGAKPTVESALNKLRKVDPKSADVLRREHFQNMQYRSAGTIQEVQTMKDFMALHGGEEEISSKIEQGDRFATELQMVAEGNRQIVKDIAGETPEGLMKLAPAVLDECQRIDPKRFGLMMAGPITRIMRETGVTPQLQQIVRMIRSGQQKESMDATNELLSWVGNMEQLAEQSKEQPISDREKEIQTRDQKVQEREARIYRGEVGKASVARTNTAISKHLTPLINDAKKKGVALTLQQKQDLATGVYSAIAASLKANKPYQRQMDAYYKRQADPDEIAEYVEGHVQRLAEQATKDVWALKGWAAHFRGNGRPGTTATGTKPTTILVSKPPQPQDIDWSKDRSRARFMGDGKVGNATLKTGKQVRFRWD